MALGKARPSYFRSYVTTYYPQHVDERRHSYYFEETRYIPIQYLVLRSSDYRLVWKTLYRWFKIPVNLGPDRCVRIRIEPLTGQ